MNRLPASLAVLLALLAAPLTPMLSAAQVRQRPNIVYVLCDDLGYGDVHAFNPDRGKIATPNLDRLAAAGMSFTDAHSASAVCTPSRYALLTGRYAWRSRLQKGVLGGFDRPLLDADRPTVAAFLKDHGYATACFGKWHLGLSPAGRNVDAPFTDGPLRHGFDHFFGIAASLDMAPFAWIEDDRYVEAPSVKKTFVREGIAAPGFEAIDVMPTLTNKAVEYVRSHGKPGQPPYFLYLAYASPHAPILPTAEWRGKSGLGDYGDFVMQNDAAVGQVLKAIDDAGQTDNTLVIFASDNGFAPVAGPRELEAAGHYPSAVFRGYKADIWDGGHRVPFIARWPGVVRPGSTAGQLVSLTDLFATVADVLGQPVPAGAAPDSFSLLPALRGSDVAVRPFDVEHSVDGYFALRQGDWKLELCAGSGGWGNPREKPARAKNLPAVQLYNLSDDAGEGNNVAADNPEVVDRLTALLEKAVADGRTTPGRPLSNDAAVEVRKSPPAGDKSAGGE